MSTPSLPVAPNLHPLAVLRVEQNNIADRGIRERLGMLATLTRRIVGGLHQKGIPTDMTLCRTDYKERYWRRGRKVRSAVILGRGWTVGTGCLLEDERLGFCTPRDNDDSTGDVDTEPDYGKDQGKDVVYDFGRFAKEDPSLLPPSFVRNAGGTFYEPSEPSSQMTIARVEMDLGFTPNTAVASLFWATRGYERLLLVFAQRHDIDIRVG